MKYLYRAFQLLVSLPVAFISTVATAVTVIIGCTIGNGHFWGYYPGKWWSKLMVRIFLLPVTVEGRENLEPEQSYVFVANHQGAFDIFLIYGYLGRNFKWMMKKSLEKIPLVGYSCKRSGHIMVDRSTPQAIRQTIENAEKQLKNGMSLVVFPEGSRSFTGKIGRFKRGAFMLASEFKLPVVPVTIDGAFEIMSRKSKLPHWGHITLTIHNPVPAPESEHCQELIDNIHRTIESSLPRHHRSSN